MIHVAAGVLVDAAGRVLLAQRPPGKHLAGMWEFPGGKLEPGESVDAGLARELQEELGIDIDAGFPLIRIPWRYGDKSLLLEARRVLAWRGEPEPREGQALRWVMPDRVEPAELAPADRPILAALRLPATYAITPAELVPAERERLVARIDAAPAQLLQLRLPLWPPEAVRRLAADLAPRHRARLLINADIDAARELGIGVHLRADQLMRATMRPLPLGQLVGASCHDAAELAQASALGVDFATLSPVLATASHPDTTPLGWPRFAELAEAAALPVYALGGMTADLLDTARGHSAQGLAGIRGFR